MNLNLLDSIFAAGSLDARHVTVAASLVLWTVAIAFTLLRPRRDEDEVDGTSCEN
ncbi:MAG: hypothetical protein HYZ75_14750 [Elusimicrobia bacterium]|nr:hypothetical protein [Elusimicrobiota bacterium]